LGPPARLTPDFTSAECKAFRPLESIPAISSSCAARFLQFGYTATLIIGGASLTSPSLIPAHIDAHARGFINWQDRDADQGKGMVQKQVTARGGWGRRPEGDAPRTEASALGARWLLPARPQPPSFCHLRVNDFEPCHQAGRGGQKLLRRSALLLIQRYWA